MATILEEVSDLELEGFRDYNLSELLFFISEQERTGATNTSISFFKILLKAFINTSSWRYQKGDSSILFFMQNTRIQTRSMFEKVCNIVPNKNLILINKSWNISINQGFYLLRHLFTWRRQLKITKLNRTQLNILLNELLKIKRLDFFLQNITIERFKLLVVFYDAQSEGNFIVQKFKNKDIKTATLSHGIVLHERDKSKIDYSGIELNGSNSDYFLAWNKFSFKEALKAGMNPEKIKVLGIPQFINAPLFNRNDDKKGVFGIVLENKSGDEFNRQLISMCNTAAKSQSFMYTIRFHPTFNGNEYDDIIERDLYKGQNEDSSIKDYAKKVDFTVMANSSVFIELVFMNQKVFRYSNGKIHDKYKDFEYNAFKSTEELINMIKANVDHSNLLFDELCTVRNIEECYFDFFKTFDKSMDQNHVGSYV